MKNGSRSLQWYKSLVYRIVIEPIPDEQGGGYEACIPTLGRSTCVAVGDTEEEALSGLKEVKEEVIESWYEEGLPIPLPENEDTFTDEYGGKILLRTSKEMHRRLVRAAERQGVSLNSLVNEAINRGYCLALFEEELARIGNQLEDRINGITEPFGFCDQQIEKQVTEWRATARQAVHLPDTGEVSFAVKDRNNVIKMGDPTQIELEEPAVA